MQNKKRSVGGVWIFSGTAHFKTRKTKSHGTNLYNIYELLKCFQ